MVLARLVTLMNGVVSAAPTATRWAVSVSPTDLSFGAITASMPAPLAVLRMAPRLCGSVTQSRMRMNGFALSLRMDGMASSPLASPPPPLISLPRVCLLSLASCSFALFRMG